MIPRLLLEVLALQPEPGMDLLLRLAEGRPLASELALLALLVLARVAGLLAQAWEMGRVLFLLVLKMHFQSQQEDPMPGFELSVIGTG